MLEHLEELRSAGKLAMLVKAHRSELRRGVVACLRRQLAAARPDPLRASQLPSSACGDSPRSVASLASSRPGKFLFCMIRQVARGGLACSPFCRMQLFQEFPAEPARLPVALALLAASKPGRPPYHASNARQSTALRAAELQGSC